MKELSIVRTEQTESVLGMKWNPHDDVFSYALSPRADISKVMEALHIPTKREMLKLVMSLFDPLGFVTFFLIHGRILIQDAWAAGLDWDAPIKEPLLQKWRLWLSYFPSLNILRIPRCYFRSRMDEPKQLHVFVDASREAYACIAYLTAMGPEGIEVAMVSAKSKVAPIKVLSVPRLELKAAVLGTRLAETVISSHSFQSTAPQALLEPNLILHIGKSTRSRSLFENPNKHRPVLRVSVKHWKILARDLTGCNL